MVKTHAYSGMGEHSGSSILRALKGGDLGGGPKGGSQKNSHQLSGVSFQYCGLHWSEAARARGYYSLQLVLISAMVSLVWFCSFLALELKHNWVLDVIPRGQSPVEVVMQGSKWELHEATLQPLAPPLRGSTTQLVIFQARKGHRTGPNHMTSDMKRQRV